MNSEPTVAVAIRLYHLTFYKSGSQWIRDVLADPRIVRYSGHELLAGGVDGQSQGLPEISPGGIAAPVYSVSAAHWSLRDSSANRALVVLRDPRDIVVSMVYSVSLSHTPTGATRLLRGPLAEASPANRIRFGMYLISHWAETLGSWKLGERVSNAYVTRYEDLVADLAGEMRRVFNFLEWDVPDQVVEEVAAENSFQSRSGRKPGVENEFSHRRKGIVGDWRNHFDRELGEAFETTFPSLLTDLGYENADDWWRTLPNTISPPRSDRQKESDRLRKVLEEQEQELVVIRTAAEQRLQDVETLHRALADTTQKLEASESRAKELLLQVDNLASCVTNLSGQLKAALAEGARERAGELLSQVHTLTDLVHSLTQQLHVVQVAADERLADILTRESDKKRFEESLVWRFGFRPLQVLGSWLHR